MTDHQHFVWRIAFLLCLITLLGCATAHQVPGVDKDRMRVFGRDESLGGSALPDSIFALSISNAAAVVAEVCYELGVPLYPPAVSNDGSHTRLTTGVFIARCGFDCQCDGSYASGDGSQDAAAIMVVDLSMETLNVADTVKALISTMFWRTETAGGVLAGFYGGASNIYFGSLGHLERRVIAALKARQGEMD